MAICGIIAEYDPFHNGHAWQLAQARRFSAADTVICAMSMHFTQRGQPALLSPHSRAEMALSSGADIVLGLPVSFSVCDAERFALGGVDILRKTGANALSFGIEPAGKPFYQAAAEALENPSEAFKSQLRKNLDLGLSFPRAQGEALASTLRIDPAILALPNTVLAICYARANQQLNAGLTLYPVERIGHYHSSELPADNDSLPSASAVRRAIAHGHWDDVKQAVPPPVYNLLYHAKENGLLLAPGCLDQLLRWELRTFQRRDRLPDISEGIENRFEMAQNCTTRDEMIQAIRSKRYSYARISRMLTHLLLHTDSSLLQTSPSYAYVLGFKKSVSHLLRNARNNDLSLLPSVVYNEKNPSILLDSRAADLWSLGLQKDFGTLYRSKPVIY